MVIKISIILTAVSIGILVIYGVDAGIAKGSDQGFLPLDHMTRGIGFGVPSVILPIIAFFISRKEPSKIFGIMLIVNAILIIIGGITALAITGIDGTEIRRVVMGSLLLGLGAFIIALGIIKLRKS